MGSPAIFAGARTKFLTAGGIEIPNRTTAQRNALTAVQGQTIYNSDTDSIDYWDGAAWKSLNQFNLANRNYFSDGNAQDISKFDLYNDGGPTPTDGIGGLVSPNLTKSLNTSSPIIGTSSYRMSKGGSVDLQGHGFSMTTDITLDAPVKAGEPITVQFRYRTSANFAVGDVKMFVYLDGPNTVQALNGFRDDGVFTNDLGATGGNIGQFTANINATANTFAIRIIGHIAATTTTNWDIDVDEITIGSRSTAPLEFLNATSSPKTPVGVGHWHQHTGNSLTLKPGVWRVYGNASFLAAGTPDYALTRVRLGDENGDDSGSPPAPLSNAVTTSMQNETNYTPNTIDADTKLVQPVVIMLTQTKTIFLQTYAVILNPSLASIIARISAERIR